MAFEQKSPRFKEKPSVDIWRKNILGRGKSKCKNFKLGLTVVFSEGDIELEWSKVVGDS